MRRRTWLVLATTTWLMAPSVHAQPFALGELRDGRIYGHWFDGEDLLVLGGYQRTVLRSRSGQTRMLPNAGGVVTGVGRGADLSLLAIEGGRLGRLRDGTWRVHVQDVIRQTPDGVALREDGFALAWDHSGRELWAISADDRIVRLPVRSDPLFVAVEANGDFVVFLRSEGGDAPVVLRWQPDTAPPANPTETGDEPAEPPSPPGTLETHPLDALVRSAPCLFQRTDALRLSTQRYAFLNYRGACVVDTARRETRLLFPRHLVASSRGRLRAAAADGPDALIVVGQRQVFRYAFEPNPAPVPSSPDPPSNPDADPDPEPPTPAVAEPIGELSGSPDSLWFDPRSGYALVFEGGAARVTPLIAREDVPSGAASFGNIRVDDEIHDQTRHARGRGFRFMLPVGRLAFGGVAEVGGNGPGAFIFDLSVGGRLVFRSGDWHPMLGFEAVYARRGGSLDTHHLGLGASISVVSARFGVGVAETLLLGVGDKGQNGVRTGLRIGTLYNAIFLDVAHGYEPGPGRHELRIQLVIDVGILAGVATIVNIIR